jgi:histidinol-phosphate aminotransferase
MNSSLELLIQPHLRNFSAYSSARSSIHPAESIFMDANENPLIENIPFYHKGIERYPDPLQQDIRVHLANIYGLNPNQIFISNGSDEIIDLLLRLFCSSGRDSVMLLPPTYGMYAIAARIQNIHCIEIPLLPPDSAFPFQPDTEAIIQTAQKEQCKILFLCSPNNPTGNILNKDSIKRILKALSHTIIVIDEAYAEFSTQQNWIKELEEWPNLLLMRTFSKAWGMAGARMGYAIANPLIISYLQRIKPPYNCSMLNQQAIAQRLEHGIEWMNAALQVIRQEKERITAFIRNSGFAAYPSEANFVLCDFGIQAPKLYQFMKENGIILRSRFTDLYCSNCLRISIGNPAENTAFLQLLEAFLSGAN